MHFLTRLSVAFTVEHNLRCSVPSRGDVLGEEAGVIVVRVGDSSQPKVADLQVTGGVQQQIARFQVSVQYIGGVNVLQAAEDLVEEVADVVIAQLLRLQQLVQVRLHEALHNVDVLHAADVGGANNVANVNDVLVLETGQDFNLSQCSLTVGLVLKGRDLLDGHLLLGDIVKCRAVKRERGHGESDLYHYKAELIRTGSPNQPHFLFAPPNGICLINHHSLDVN